MRPFDNTSFYNQEQNVYETRTGSIPRLAAHSESDYIILKRPPVRSMGERQNLERPNVERPIFRKFETSNTEITKVELFIFFRFKFISHIYVCLNCLNSQNICDNLQNWKFLVI